MVKAIGGDASHPLDQFSFTCCVLFRLLRLPCVTASCKAFCCAADEVRPVRAIGHQHGHTGDSLMLLIPFWSMSTTKVLALKATVLLLLTLLIKARVQILTGSALGIGLLLLQTLVFLAISGGVMLAAGGAAFYANQQRRSAAT